jgi:transcription antitermination factor NusG
MTLLMNGDGPAKVGDHIIDELRGRERNGLIVLPPPSPAPRLRPGDQVRVMDGPLTGFSGLVDAPGNEDRESIRY